jgi:hypothetical protein
MMIGSHKLVMPSRAVGWLFFLDFPGIGQSSKSDLPFPPAVQRFVGLYNADH